MIDPGTELAGRYRVVRLLGEGGMGAVYEAEHTAIGRRVAVKVLHSHFGSKPAAVARFEREARAAGAIGHPNIVEVIDFGMHGRLPFIAMELLRGETLAERLARVGVLSPREACRVVGHVLSALAAAHAAGIVHRDLKPENVFLHARGGEPEVVKLVDFGVSKFRTPGAGLHVTTQEGTPMGTPSYMAPEQWMGQRDIDHRADLYAAGVMLYELLTGALPYEAATQGELFLEVVKGTDPPSIPSALAPEVPARLDAIAVRAVSRDRDARFPSAAAFLAALQPFGAEDITAVDAPPAPAPRDSLTPHPARRTPAGQRTTVRDDDLPAWDGARGRRLRAGASALVAVVVLGAAVAALAPWRAPRPAHAPRPAAAAPAHAPRPERAPAAPPATVAVELRGLGPGAVVTVDGAPAAGSVLHLPRASGAHAVGVRVGDIRREFTVQSDRDQVIVLDLRASSPAPSPARRAAPSTRPSRRTGVGALNVSREF